MSEIARLGEEHITIRTQYRLLPISGAGFLLSDLQRYMLRGTHQWEELATFVKKQVPFDDSRSLEGW